MRRPEHERQPKRKHWLPHWLRVTLIVWLLSGMNMTGCCSPQVSTYALGKSEMRQNADKTWTVSAGWMARRQMAENGLKERLAQCKATRAR